MKKILALLVIGIMSLSCAKTWHNDSPIDTAVAASFTNITSSSVTVSLTPTNAVASYLVTDPALADAVGYLSMDAKGRLEYIQEHGRESDSHEKNHFVNHPVHGCPACIRSGANNECDGCRYR